VAQAFQPVQAQAKACGYRKSSGGKVKRIPPSALGQTKIMPQSIRAFGV